MKTIVSGMCIILLLVVFSVCPGCTSSATPDPESGIRTWVTAVNERNYARLYDLAPREIQNAISRDDFIKEQETNPFLAPGNSIVGYTIISGSGSGNSISRTAQLIMMIRDEKNLSLMRNIPLYIKFVEQFENGEWKVWTTEP